MAYLRHISVLAVLFLAAFACTPDEPEERPTDAGSDADAASVCAAVSELLSFYDEERRTAGIGDVTGDGVGESVVLQQDDEGFVLSLGPEAGIVMGPNGYLLSVLSADLNADGQADLVLGQPWASQVAVFLGPVRQTVSWEGADHIFAAPTMGGLENRFGYSTVVGLIDGDNHVDLVINAPAEQEEFCFGQEPPRLYSGPLQSARYERDDASFELDATENACIGLMATCIDGGFELRAESDDDCVAYKLPLSESTSAMACD